MVFGTLGVQVTWSLRLCLEVRGKSLNLGSDPKLGQRPKKNSLKVSASQRLAANRNGEARELDKKSSLALGYCPEQSKTMKNFQPVSKLLLTVPLLRRAF